MVLPDHLRGRKKACPEEAGNMYAGFDGRARAEYDRNSIFHEGKALEYMIKTDKQSIHDRLEKKRGKVRAGAGFLTALFLCFSLVMTAPVSLAALSPQPLRYSAEIKPGAVMYEDILNYLMRYEKAAQGGSWDDSWRKSYTADETRKSGAYWNNFDFRYEIGGGAYYQTARGFEEKGTWYSYRLTDQSVYLDFLKDVFSLSFTAGGTDWVPYYLEHNFANCHWSSCDVSGEERREAVMNTITVNGMRYVYTTEEYPVSKKNAAGTYPLPWHWFQVFALYGNYVLEMEFAWNDGSHGLTDIDSTMETILGCLHYPTVPGTDTVRTPVINEQRVVSGSDPSSPGTDPLLPAGDSGALDFFLPASGNQVVYLSEQYSWLNFNFTEGTEVEGLDFSAGNIYLMEDNGSGKASADDAVAFRWDLDGEKARYLRGYVQYRANWLGWRFPSDGTNEYTGTGKDYTGIRPGQRYYLRVDPGVIRLKGASEPFSTGQPGSVPDWTVTVLSEESTRNEGWFAYASSKGFDPDDPDEKKAYYRFDTAWFSFPSRQYNPHLALLSLDMAIAASSGREELPGKDSYYIEEFFEKLGFENIRPNHWYFEPTEDDSCAVCVASRKLGGSHSVTLIAVAIRGGNYGKEWAGNFHVDTGVEHEGFRLGKEEVLRCLKEYVEEQGIKGRVKVWISGYSRASAICNLTAAELTRGYDLAGATLEPDDLFAYGFEVPACTRDTDAGSSQYRNIFSIVNPTDFVPRLPLAQWGYRRYGTVLFLPTPTTDRISYYQYADEMQKHFYDLYGEAIPYMPSAEQVRDLSVVMEALYSVIRSPEDLFNKSLAEVAANKLTALAKDFAEEQLRKKGFLLLYYLLNGASDIEYDFDIDQSCQEFAMDMARSSLGDQSSNDDGVGAMAKVVSFIINWDKADTVVGQLIDYMDTLELLPGARPGAVVVRKIMEKLDRSFSVPGIVKEGVVEDTIRLAHYMEFTLAWMEVLENSSVLENSAEPGSLSPGSRYYTRMIRVNCPVYVDVWDEEGEWEVSFTEDSVRFSPDAGAYAYIDTDGTKVILLSADREVRILAEAYDSGTMQISVETIDPLGTTGERVTRWYDLPLEKGDTYELALSTGFESADYEAELKDPAGKERTPDMDESGGNIRRVSVIVQAVGNGAVTGGGIAAEGSVVSLSASAYEGEEFLGWYDAAGALLSMEMTYSFRAEADVVCEARFTENQEIFPETEQSGEETEEESEEQTEEETEKATRGPRRSRETEETGEAGESREETDKGFPLLPVVIIATVLAAGGGVAAVLLKKRKK